MYDGPIIDPHIHLWDLAKRKHAWLLPPAGAVRARGGLEERRAEFLVADFLRDSAAQPIEASVHVEARWDAADPVGETRWLEMLDKDNNVAARYVAAAPFSTPEAARRIDEQAAFSRVVGIRAILSFHPANAAKNFAPRDGIAFEPVWRGDFILRLPSRSGGEIAGTKSERKRAAGQ
jgi:predicted TIM-barrel fold metal-dependent hydrolase